MPYRAPVRIFASKEITFRSDRKTFERLSEDVSNAVKYSAQTVCLHWPRGTILLRLQKKRTNHSHYRCSHPLDRGSLTLKVPLWSHTLEVRSSWCVTAEQTATERERAKLYTGAVRVRNYMYRGRVLEISTPFLILAILILQLNCMHVFRSHFDWCDFCELERLEEQFWNRYHE